jgi:hypothetical protein
MNNENTCHGPRTKAPCSGQMKLPRESYTTHLRLSSRTSFDNSYPPPSPTPRPRPRSAIYEHHRSHHLWSPPRVSFDRWSYDRERMMPHEKEDPPSPRPKSALSHLTPPLQVHRRAVSTGDLPTLSYSLPQPYSQTLSPSVSLKNHQDNRDSMLTTCTVEFDLVDPSSPGKGAKRLSLVEVEHDHSHNNLKNTNTRHDREGPLKRKEEEEEIPGAGCCGCCELGTAKLVGGKLAAWITGTMLPIAFGFTKEFLSNCFK